MAEGLQRLMGDVQLYEELAHNARGRVCDFFQLEDAMGAYNRLYRELGGMPVADMQEREVTAGPVDPTWSGEVAQPADSGHARQQVRTTFGARSGIAGGRGSHSRVRNPERL